ncbi:MAG: metallopeptidase TldD-related protein [Slackia sp.]|nr:metallopeptidase TldD-related protein [Slackia sp.]
MNRSCRIDFHYRKRISLFRDEEVFAWNGSGCSTVLSGGDFVEITGGEPPLLAACSENINCFSDRALEKIRRIGKKSERFALYFESRSTRKEYLFCDGEKACAIEKGLICGCSAMVGGAPCNVQLAFDCFGESVALRALSLIEEFVDHAALRKKDVIPVRGDLVFSERASGMFIHEFIGHSLEQDNYGHSWMSTGEVSGNLSVFENWNTSDVYDDLGGLVPSNLPILTNGQVSNLMHSGNYRVSFFDNPFPGIRMRKMRVGLGSKTKGDLVGETARGVFIDEIDDGEIEHSTGEISFNIRKARLIENGELSDYLIPFAFFANISNLGSSFLEFGDRANPSSIACGKGGSLVVVGVESPAMKLHSFERVGRCG